MSCPNLRIIFQYFLLVCGGAVAAAQSVPPLVPAAAPTINPKDYMPVCSTEKVNGNCFVNIDRRVPITMPTFQMKRGSHITVYVFHPLPFENLTLDPGPAAAYESSDQGSAVVTALIPFGKGASFGTVDSDLKLDSLRSAQFTNLFADIEPAIKLQPPQNPQVVLANDILLELNQLNDLLDQALRPVSSYLDETNAIYAQVRELESAIPRPSKDIDVTKGRQPTPGVPDGTPDPWQKYGDWRDLVRKELTTQGGDTTQLLDRLPGACQKSTDPRPLTGLWLPSPRSCGNLLAGPINSSKPLAIDAAFDTKYASLEKDILQLKQNPPSQEIYDQILGLKQKLDERKSQVLQSIAMTNDLLPALMTKVTTDMQTVYENVSLTPDKPGDPIRAGVISDPAFAVPLTPEEKQILAPYKALAPSDPYTLNAQNEIANSLLGLPAASQKQPLVTITSVYAAPRFEVSSGAFFSWLPNRTYSNLTDVSVISGVPTPQDVKIDMTTTVRPLVIPFAAANYRISPEFTWLGGRRGAIYATVGVGLNAYDTLVEYPIGFSVSWRFLMFSPLYHLGHGVHLTQNETVGQLWCQYPGATTPVMGVPACSGSPPAPSTKTFWTGQFAIGISVRIPTTFNSTNH
jgi:hypothetical protein